VTTLAHALAGLAVILSFALVGQQWLRPMLWLCAAQAFVVALVILLQRDLRLVLFALVAFALNGMLMPLLLARRVADERVARTGKASWVGGVVLVAVSVATAMQVSDGGRVELLGAALALLLLGLPQSARSPASGLLSAQNGLVLLIATVPHVATVTLIAVAVPVVPAALALPSRQAANVLPAWRFGTAIAMASTALLFLLACWMLLRPPHQTWLLNVGPPNTYLVLLVSFAAMATGWLNLYHTQGQQLHQPYLLLLTGAIMLALLSDEPALTWLASALAVYAVTNGRFVPADFVPLGAAMLLALAGTLLLYLAAGSSAVAWSGSPIASGRTLNLAGIFLLIGYGALAVQVPSLLLVTVPLLVMLRLRDLGVAPELLLALGLAALWVAVSLRREMTAALGLIVFAIGLGEATAALLLTALLTLLVAARQVITEVRTQRFASLALAALPLFAFSLVADATVARSLWLLPPLAIGAIAASVAAVR
jgi:hypothetical protein